MKKAFVLCALLCGALMTTMHATHQFQPATVISVERNETPARFDATGSTDTPLLPAIYTYNVGVQLGNTIYQLAYDSALEDVSPVFVANQAIQVIRKGGVLYVALPGNRTVPLAIENRTEVKRASLGN
jgi:hypothetical protein